MVLLVALFGNWIISILPEEVQRTFDYILPAVIGAVFVQLAFMLKDPISTAVSLALGVFGVFFFAEWLPNWSALVLPIVVIGTVITAMVVGSRKYNAKKSDLDAHDDAEQPIGSGTM